MQAKLARPSTPGNGLYKFIQMQGDRVLVDITIKGDPQAAKTELTKLGFITKASYGRMLSGSIPISALSKLEVSPVLKFAQPAYKPLHQTQPFAGQLNITVPPKKLHTLLVRATRRSGRILPVINIGLKEMA